MSIIKSSEVEPSAFDCLKEMGLLFTSREPRVI